MKLVIPYFIVLSFLLSSCSKYENSNVYEKNNVDLSSKIISISSDELNVNEAQLFDMVNAHRSSIGLNELVFESISFYYAGLHTDFMIEKGETSHTNFNERAKSISEKTGAVFVAENVARNYDTMQEAFTAWLESPEHRQNIEGDFNYSAISVRPNSNGDFYFTQIFFR